MEIEKARDIDDDAEYFRKLNEFRRRESEETARKRVGSKDGDTFGAIIITVVGSVLLIILIVLTIK